MANKLAGSTSPYLLQHQDNPVDWYPWSEEALSRARSENRPILVSIGYSSCHWCHVMAHESFENPAIAALMNEHFVSIKVDREERPDIDAIYMTAVQAMTGQGGWPLNVFLTPDGVPFFGGTYWPPRDQRGMPGFPSVLQAVANAWSNNREGVIASAGQILDFLERSSELAPAADSAVESVGETALATLGQSVDQIHGGFGTAPKFPQAPVLEFLHRHAHRTESEEAARILHGALRAMARGGIYDQIGGGFSRYTVDEAWRIPHFEKMLYDNGHLLSLIAQAAAMNREADFADVVEQSIEWACREMRAPEGGFYAALDADSEGEQGKFYVWTLEEIRALLPPDEADLVQLHYGMTAHGNFEGANVLYIARDLEDIAAAQDRPVRELERTLDSARARLLEARSTRTRPGTDTKVITSWNALMIKALAQAGMAYDRPGWIERANETAKFIVSVAWSSDRRLARTATGGEPGGRGLLEDHAFLADALLALYAATAESRWLTVAGDLVATVRERFRHSSGLGFYDTAEDHEALIVRPRDLQDGATPSGNAVALDAMWTLSQVGEDETMRQTVLDLLSSLEPSMVAHPSAFGRFLAVRERTRAGERQVVIAGDAASPGGVALRREVTRRVDPFLTLGFATDDDRWPALANRSIPSGADAAAYVCQGTSCLPPVVTANELRALLDRGEQMPG